VVVVELMGDFVLFGDDVVLVYYFVGDDD